MIEVAITMMNEALEVLESRAVTVFNTEITGVSQVKDFILDSMYTWLNSRDVKSNEFETYEGNPVLYVEMVNGDTFYIGGNITDAIQV